MEDRQCGSVQGRVRCDDLTHTSQIRLNKLEHFLTGILSIFSRLLALVPICNRDLSRSTTAGQPWAQSISLDRRQISLNDSDQSGLCKLDWRVSYNHCED